MGLVEAALLIQAGRVGPLDFLTCSGYGGNGSPVGEVTTGSDEVTLPLRALEAECGPGSVSTRELYDLNCCHCVG